MTGIIRLFIAALSLLAGCSGQTHLSIRDAVERALAANALMEAARTRIDSASGFLDQAGRSPNPTFVFQQESIRLTRSPSFRYWDDTDTFAMVQRRFETGDKREDRVAAAKRGIERAELERALLALQIAGRVKSAYWEAAGAQRIHELLSEAVRNFAQIVQYHEAQVKEGAMAEADLLRVQLEAQRLALAADDAGMEADQARIRLFREIGTAPIPSTVRLDALTWPAGPAPAADPKRALAERPEMKLARLAVERARDEMELQRSQAKPDIQGTLGYKRTAGFHTLVAGLQFDIPVGNRNQGNIAAAAAAMQAARYDLAAAEVTVRAEVGAAEAAVTARGRQIAEALAPMLQRAGESSQIAEAAYREGGWDLLRLLDSERLRIDTETLYYRALAAFHQGLAALEGAIGVVQ